MTSIRLKAKQGVLTKADIKFFEHNKGTAPLCCIRIWFTHPQTHEKYPEPLYRCDQLKKAIPWSEFEPFCLECQKEIEECIKKKGGKC